MYNPQLTYERIQQRCKEIGMKITDLNAKCNISKDTLSKAAKSSDGMKAANIFAVAQNIKCSADYLLGLTAAVTVGSSEVLDDEDDALNESEMHLVELYRKLSPIDRARLIERAETLVENTENSFKEEDA